MPVIVELISVGEFRGWALNDEDWSDIIMIELRGQNGLLAKLQANQYRRDLADQCIGNGCHSFRSTLNSDLLLMSGDGRQLFVRATTSRGVELPVTYVHGGPAQGGYYMSNEPPSLGGLAVTADGSVNSPAIFGESFFLDAIGSSDGALMRPRAEVPSYARCEGFLAIRMYVYGDMLWWREEGGVTERSAAPYFDHLGPRTRALIADGRIKIVFDMSNEGPPARHYGDWVQLLHDELTRQGISPLSCVMINQNRVYEFDYRLWGRENNVVELMDVLNYDYYVARMARSLEALPLEKALDIPKADSLWKVYTCLNFTPRPTRVSFVAWLVASGLAAHGELSFAGMKNFKADGKDFTVASWFPERDITITGMAQLRDMGPMTLDLERESGTYVPEFDLGPIDSYARTFLTVVTESDFSPGDVRRVTEKVIKPLALGHPVVVVGNPGSLQLLRDYGFQTFSPWIDETYDLIDDRRERMRRVQGELRRLCSMSFDQLAGLRRSLEAVTDHNVRHARRGLAQVFSAAVERDLITQLQALHTRTRSGSRA